MIPCVFVVFLWCAGGVLWCICCSDINECENEDLCMYGRCVNKPGGYECLCDDEHQLIPTGTGCVGLYSLYINTLHHSLSLSLSLSTSVPLYLEHSVTAASIMITIIMIVLVIERSLVRLPAGALSSQLGQLSFPSLRDR